MALPPLPADPPPGPTPFEDDVRLARAGDPRAFDRVCGVMGPRLHRYATTLLRGDVAAAEDVVQEALLAAWQALPTLRAPELLRGWLFSVTHRRSMGWLRTRARRRTDALSDDDASAPTAPTRGNEGAEAEARTRLLRTLRALPVHYMAPLSLCYLEGLGARETARVLSLSLGTLKMRLYRGRNLLRRRLVHQGEWSPHVRKPVRREAGSRVATQARSPSPAPDSTPSERRTP